MQFADAVTFCGKGTADLDADPTDGEGRRVNIVEEARNLELEIVEQWSLRLRKFW
jgi:hypothetical protein